MSNFAIRSDMEGLCGVVSWDEVVPGGVLYEKARLQLQREIDALCQALTENGAQRIEIYDEHYYGLNLEVDALRSGVVLYRGKPPYTERWPGGLNATFAGLILQGYHAMAGVEEGILSHTYEPDIAAIRLNGRLVGEIGVEAGIAGEAGVPFALYLGDEHGAQEAMDLVPEVETIAVKHGRGCLMGQCRSWPDVGAEIAEKAGRIARQKSSGFLRFETPVKMEIELREGPYQERLFRDEPSLETHGHTLVLKDKSLISAWARYWVLKNETLEKLKAEKRVD